ncbi:MAG: penicillin-binding protein 2 [Candidatus Marinimicrobia bacterium]|nr:penicillin-binding protein 2 [Candidatus Neomarinimicrobiota bacterium]
MFYSQNNVTLERRNLLILIVLTLFVILIARLYQLQIVQYSRFAGIAEANRIRVISREAPRGIIFDRNGNIIADNKSQYNVNLIPFEVGQNENVYNILSEILKIPEQEIRRRVRKNWRGQFLPARIAEDIDFETLTELEERRLELPGVLFSLEPIRSFPAGANLSQVLGYLREVGKKDLRMIKDYGYRPGDLIGWEGVEHEYESILRGKRGYSFVQVNAFGQEVGEVRNKRSVESKFGNDLYLTIDLGLQQYAEELLNGKKGVIVAMDALNGEILSLVSKPDYSPNLFSGIVRSDVWNSLRNDPDKPLYNRVTQGTYSPGSTFKMVAALASLEETILDPKTSFRCRGSYKLGRRDFKCWKLGGHGRMNLSDAIVNSCNVYFYSLIRKMDIDIWAEYARKFRFGELTNIDMYGESQGLVPDKAFMDEKYGISGWTEGNKLNLVIGQGDLLVTPIQMVRFAGTLATNGKLSTPHLGLKYFDRDNDRFHYFAQSTGDSIDDISTSSWEFIQKAMYDVVNSRTGTGRAAKVRGLDVYGKTGTAQNPHGDPHSWFIGFVKKNEQVIAIAILVEHGGSGGGEAAVIASRLFRYYQKELVPQHFTSRGINRD